MCAQSWSKKYRKRYSSPYMTAHFLSDTHSLPACVSYLKMFLKVKTKDVPENIFQHDRVPSFGLFTIETDVLLLSIDFLY